MTKRPQTKHRTKRKRRRRRQDEEHHGTIAIQQPSSERDLTSLQNQIGNAAVQRLLDEQHGLQAQQGNDSQALVQNALQRREEQKPEVQPANGQVTIEEPIIDYYDVGGSTLAAVATELDSDEWGRCAYSYEMSYESTNGKATKVDITLTLTIRLPRWQQGWSNASDAAKAEWNKMLEALGVHEEKHAEIARNWAPKIKERLLGLPGSRVTPKFKQLKKKVEKETEKFDKQTKHGHNEGVNLDLSIQ